MGKKCFCHFNGYEVKDARARRSILFSLDNVVCVGDSFLEGYTTSGNVTSWGGTLEELAKQENPSAIFRLAYEGGSGFATSGKSGHTFVDLIESLAAELTEENKNDVQTVIIVGGVNDVNSGKSPDPTNTIATAKNNFPNAKIVVAFSPVVQMVSYDNIGTITTMSRDPDVCILHDSIRWLLGASKYDSGDQLHPNAAGHAAIGAHIFHRAKGLETDEFIKEHIEYSGDWGSIGLNTRKHNGLITMTITGKINAGSVAAFTEIGTTPSWMRPTVDVPIPIYTSNGSRYIYFTNGKTIIVGSASDAACSIKATVMIDPVAI